MTFCLSLAGNQYKSALFKFTKHSFKRCQGESESEIYAILQIQMTSPSRLRKSVLILAKILELQNTTRSTILVGVRFIQLKQYQTIVIVV